MSTMQLTPRDVELLVNGLQCLKDPKLACQAVFTSSNIDYKKLADIMGFKTPASANTSWLNLKKKLFAAGESGDGSSPANTPSKATAKGAKAQNGDGDEQATQGDAEDEAVETKKTPKKRTRKPKATPEALTSPPSNLNAFTNINADDVEGPETSPTHSKKRGRTDSATPGATVAKKRGRKIKQEQQEDEPTAEDDGLTLAYSIADAEAKAKMKKDNGDDDAGNNSEATTHVSGPTEGKKMLGQQLAMPDMEQHMRRRKKIAERKKEAKAKEEKAKEEKAERHWEMMQKILKTPEHSDEDCGVYYISPGA